MNTIELLAPAGSPEALDAAVGEGADAVYLGLKDFNARMRSANFSYAQFEGALRSLRRMKKKVYVTVNTVFEQREADRMYQFLKYLSQQGPDAIIVQDFGVVQMALSEFPGLRLHASTQMNIASARGANALSRHGISRVVLARELSLEELRGIKKETNLELEVFVHGALCVSVSGLCLFSSYLGGKSANRGMCTQACRRLYHRTDHLKTGNSSEPASGYYFSPNDLQLLEHVPDLYNAGVNALKIEGRMKSASYAGVVVSAYRLVADALMSDDDEEIQRSVRHGQEILRGDFARAKTKYLFTGSVTVGGGVDSGAVTGWLNPNQDGGTGISLGTILKVRGKGEESGALVSPARGITLSARDSVRIHRQDDSGRISHKLSFTEKQPQGNSYWISMPHDASFGKAKPGDYVYLIQTKETRKRYAPVITHNGGGSGPGRDKSPVPQIAIKKTEPARKTRQGAKLSEADFPEGIYIAAAKPEDLYIVQSSRPKRVMLPLSEKNSGYLLADNKPPLPFKPSEIILTLDPFFPQDARPCFYGRQSGENCENKTMADEIGRLIEKGYCQYTVNNPGHLSLFRGYSKIKLIAGPWLYIFNSWALSFVSSLGVDAFITPLENNRQNLERTLNAIIYDSAGRKRNAGKATSSIRSKFFITVFAWPPLFNIRANLDSALKFRTFADNMEENFLLVAERDGSRVYPEKYFSITDKIPFLKEAGFERFIIDLRGPVLKKSHYRDLMKAVNENAPLPNSIRFNWKDGFYSV